MHSKSKACTAFLLLQSSKITKAGSLTKFDPPKLYCYRLRYVFVSVHNKHIRTEQWSHRRKFCRKYFCPITGPTKFHLKHVLPKKGVHITRHCKALVIFICEDILKMGKGIKILSIWYMTWNNLELFYRVCP